MSNVHTLKLDEKEPRNIAFKELSLIGSTIFWKDIVCNGKNRNSAIFARPFNDKEAKPQQLTGNFFDIKSDFHGYGGKSYKCIVIKENFYLIWIDRFSKAIWLQIFKVSETQNKSKGLYLLSVEEPRQISKSIEANFDSSFVITQKNYLLGICEIKNIDYLFSLNLEKNKQNINLLKKFDNFAGELSSNNSGNFLSWLEWDISHMPWDKNDLFFAEIDFNGEIKKLKKFSNKFINANRNVSFFQPYWLNEKILVCSEDSSGWWNLLFIEITKIDKVVIKLRIKRNLFEYGAPQWVSGQTFFSGSFANLFCLAKTENRWILEHYSELILKQKFYLPFSKVSEFSIFKKKVTLVGYGFNFKFSLLEIDFQKKVSSNFINELSFEIINKCSKPESFWFKGYGNKFTHSFLYRPLYNIYRKPPLIIRAHSGPTTCFDGSYNSEVQYWASKGFFIAEVNYGGSSGFGRSYRERLNSKWGIIDSYDCKALVNELLHLDLIDRDKIIIFGNSAGGFTALNSLCSCKIFKAAVCKYPVIDLMDMYFNTHRFEKNYLESLVGNYETSLNVYKDRSPINKIRKIKKPILLFHGKKDSVISFKQTFKIQKQLIENNKLSKVVFFENEGHGFKNISNKKQVMQETEEFIKKVLEI